MRAMAIAEPPGKAGGERPVRAIVADDSVLLREGIVRLLESGGFEVVAQAGDAEDLMRKALAHKPDVAIIDIRMPPRQADDGLRAAVEIRRRLPETGVLVLSQYVEESYALDLVAESAERTGYLLKDRVADVRDFVDALTRVAAGGTALDPEVVTQLMGASRRREPLSRLTPREQQVLRLMAEGLSNAGIAASLVVSDGAVEKHIANIFAKLDLPPSDTENRRVLAVLRYLES